MTKEAITRQITEHPNYMMEKSFRLRFPDAYADICRMEFPEHFCFNQKVYHYLNNDFRFLLGVCPECGKRCGYLNFFKGYSKYCSLKCSSNAREVRDKTAETCVSRFGYASPLSCPDIRKSGIDKMVELYGVEYATQSPVIQERIKRTSEKEYGYDRPSKSPVVKKRIMETNMKNIGVPWPGMSMSVMKKARETNNRKRGVDWPMQDASVRNKSAETSMGKYGCESPNSSPVVKGNKIKACLEKYGVANVFQLDWVKEKLSDTNMRNIGYPNPFMSPQVQTDIKRARVERRGDDTVTSSKEEHELFEYISGIYSGCIIENDKFAIGKEIDVYLPDLGIGFEFNGDYWHMNPELYSENDINKTSGKTAREYWESDKRKISIAESKGIRIYVVWENDWKRRNAETKEKIRNIIYGLIKSLDE